MMKEKRISQILTMEGEDEANEWLAENAELIEVVNISFAIGRGFVDVFMIHYKVKEEDLNKISGRND